MKTNIADLEEKMAELKSQLDFMFRVMAAAAVDQLDSSLQLTADEAYQGVVLGQRLVQEMFDLVRAHSETKLK